MAGTESAVHLSDCLSERLNVRSNGVELSSCRRDKYIMGERIRECGVRAVAQRKCVTLEEGLEFARGHIGGILVLKPTLSAGSDDVYKVAAEDVELFTEKFNAIIGKTVRVYSRRIHYARLCLELPWRGVAFFLSTFFSFFRLIYHS